MMRIGVAGIAGRVGRLLAEEIVAGGAILSGGTIRPGAAPPEDLPVLADIATLAETSDVVIDFSSRDAVGAHAAALAAAGTAYVLGITGLAPADDEALAVASTRIAIVEAANFSPGVTLALVLAGRMAAALPGESYDAEILEMHHRQKVDAPSGTALALGQAVAAARHLDFAEVRDSVRDGHTGPRRPGAIGFATLRGGQIVGEHTLLFTSAGEQVALTHRAFDRRVFATGAVRAALWIRGKPPGRYTMRDVLDV